MRQDIRIRNAKILKLYQQGVARKEIAYKLSIAYETIRKAIWILRVARERMKRENRNKNNRRRKWSRPD